MGRPIDIWKGESDMKYQIIGRNVTITKAMENAVLKKMSRIERYFDGSDEVKCTATISTGHHDQTIEIAIVTTNMNLRAKVTNNDVYAALDLAIDKLEGQMRKMKTLVDRNKKKSLTENIRMDLLKEEDVPSAEEIVKRKKLDLTPMDLDEALTRMEALDHSFFIYLDSATGKINVLYVRQDEGYGVIEINEEE